VRGAGRVDDEELLRRALAGSQSAFATMTGAIFELGVTDAVLQMWAALLAERAGAWTGASAARRPPRRSRPTASSPQCCARAGRAPPSRSEPHARLS
jgi:hypothetical protein